MIQENELRVGNYLYDGVGGIIKVEVDDLYDNVRKFYKPIELTEEILLKCGLEKHSTNPFWFRKKQICISLSGSIELISWDMQVFKIDSKAEYLHQLQNLYFALTGKELEINL